MIKIFTFSSNDNTLDTFQDTINDYIESNRIEDFEVKVAQSEDNHNVNLTVILIIKK